MKSFDDLPFELQFEIYKYCDFISLNNIGKIGYDIPNKIIINYKSKRQIVPYHVSYNIVLRQLEKYMHEQLITTHEIININRIMFDNYLYRELMHIRFF